MGENFTNLKYFLKILPINIVAHEQVVGVGSPAAHSEQLDQVVELSMHVAAHRHGALHFLHIRLRFEDFRCLK